MTAADTPARPFAARRALLLGFLTLLVLGGGLFGWGIFATLAGAVIAAGQVEVETRDQVVEHIDGGTVGEILVRDGDRVQAGDVLIRLDDKLLRSEEAMLEAEYAELVARRNRLEAEFRDADVIAWNAELAALADGDATVRAMLDGQGRLFEARRSSRAGQAAQLRERIGQMGEQIAGLQAQQEATQRQVGFIAQELDAQRSLSDRGLTDLPELLRLERAAAQLDGQAGDLAARMAEARGRIAEIEIQILQIDSRRIEEAEAQAREVQARENQVRERLLGVRERLGRLEVRAPVAGEVVGMQVFALREVVRPGEPILRLVPQEARLVVLARLQPIYVDQVYPGQAAVLRFSAFPSRTTPRFEGRIARISADAVPDERSGLSWYELEVRIGGALEAESGTGAAAWLEIAAKWLRSRLPWFAEPAVGAPAGAVQAQDLALTPGMPVEVHVRTGERSPLSYLAKPLTDYFSRSMREE